MRWHSRRRPQARFWLTGALSLVFHGVGGYGLSSVSLPTPERQPEERVLQLKLVPRTADRAPPAPESPPELPVETNAAPAPAPPAPAPAPAPPVPQVDVAPPPGPGTLPLRPPLAPPRSFASFRQQRFQKWVPSRFTTRGSGRDSAESEGRDRCEPMPGRRVERLYLLYDASGSMGGPLQSQALRCAQQYASAAIESGAEVVVGSFAGNTVLSDPTRSYTEVAMALRAPNDHSRTLLPSTELYRTFDGSADAATDLVILSDGHIPNYQVVLSSYRYFLELNPENRGYMYTLGVPGHPAVVSALRGIGFDVYVYRLF